MKESINNISFCIYLDLLDHFFILVFKINHFLTQKTTFFYKPTDLFYMTGVHAWREEGEEKHPPVGKDINRPKFPNNSPPCHDVHAW